MERRRSMKFAAATLILFALIASDAGAQFRQPFQPNYGPGYGPSYCAPAVAHKVTTTPHVVHEHVDPIYAAVPTFVPIFVPTFTVGVQQQLGYQTPVQAQPQVQA